VFRVVHAKRGPRKLDGFAAKPMLRIVNMPKRLRPVYPGVGATDFAIDLCNLPGARPVDGATVHAGCRKFQDIITDCIQPQCGISSTLAGKAEARAYRSGISTRCRKPVATVELSYKTRVCKVFRVCNNVKTLKCCGAARMPALIMHALLAQQNI
jgi:hypothetical protein